MCTLYLQIKLLTMADAQGIDYSVYWQWWLWRVRQIPRDISTCPVRLWNTWFIREVGVSCNNHLNQQQGHNANGYLKIANKPNQIDRLWNWLVLHFIVTNYCRWKIVETPRNTNDRKMRLLCLKQKQSTRCLLIWCFVVTQSRENCLSSPPANIVFVNNKTCQF